MRLNIAAILSMLIVAALTSGAFAETGGGPQGGQFGMHGGDFQDSGKMVERLTKRLNLNDAQQQSVQNILDGAQPEIEALRERAKANREAMQALDTSDPNHSTVLNSVAVESGQLVTERSLLFFRVHNEVNAVLTDEQRETLAESRDGMHERRGDRKNKGRSNKHHRRNRAGTNDDTSEQ